MPATSKPPPSNIFDDIDDIDDDGWQDMPVVREDEFASGLDEEDQKKYHYMPSAKGKTAANATGNLIDVDDLGNEWRSKLDRDESEYTRLRVNEEDEADEVHLRTKYLFDEDKAMTPLSQMQATKGLLTEAQRIAYVGLCALTSREMAQTLKGVRRKELKAAVTNMELWAMKIMGRLYYHMELETQEQKMIESLAEHGVQAVDLVPSLMTTHTVANPEYDPEEARRKAKDEEQYALDHLDSPADTESISGETLVEHDLLSSPQTPKEEESMTPPGSPTRVTLPTAEGSPVPGGVMSNPHKTTAKVLQDTSKSAMPGVSTTLSSADENVTLDIRWTVLCDLFLILIADSVYDARSRVLLENVAQKLGLGWLDVVKFESRVTEALEIQEDVEKLEQQEIVEGARKAGKRRRYVMMGLATLGGGLVIGLSAGLLAPVIGAGLAGAFATVGVTGTAGFLGGAAGAAVITTGGVLTGSGIAARGMSNRTQQVRTFDILPLHNNKRVSCILTVPGFMNGINDDVRLPFSVLDPIVGDVFSVLWEPEMIRETGSALKILTGEVLSQIGLTVLQATAMTTLMSALQWPIILTKLGYLIDNPWSNALDRARGAGRVLADVLIQRHLGVRPITLIGFSLGARVIFYALLELAKQKQFGIVQDVFLLGATLTASTTSWLETRSVVSGRYVNAFARNDWVLNYLFRATSGGVGTVAGLRPVQNVPGLENVDVTDKIAGHMSYRTFMPLILDQLGFPVFVDYFDEPEEPDFTEERIVVREDEQNKKKGWFSRRKSTPLKQQHVSRPPSSGTFQKPLGTPSGKPGAADDDDLPPRMESTTSSMPASPTAPVSGVDTTLPASQPVSGATTPANANDSSPSLPMHAGFDLNAMKDILTNAEHNPVELKVPPATEATAKLAPPPERPASRSQSTPPTHVGGPAWGHEPDLPGHFGRSVSISGRSRFQDGEEDQDEDEPKRGGMYASSSSSSSQANGYRAGSSWNSSGIGATPRPSHMPLTFTADDDEPPSWGAPSSSALKTPTANPFATSSPSFAGGNPFASPSTSSLAGNPFASSTPVSAFAPSVSSGLVFGSDAGLAFGAADGTITAPPVADPWRVGADSGKRTPGFGTNANPWG